MKNIKIIAFAIGITACLFSCKKEDVTIPPTPISTTNKNEIKDPSTLIRIGETYINGASANAIVYAEKTLIVGYNNLYIAMYDSVDQSKLTDGHLGIMPLMDMGSMVHSAPFEVNSEMIPSNQLWSTAVVFIMPGNWNFKIDFHNHKNDLEGEGNITLNIVNPTTPVHKNFMVAADSTKLFISLLQPLSPKIGLNDFEITIHKKQDMMAFPSAEYYTVEIVPEMPSMNHGSPNNTNPIHTGMGHYKGKVNFTMTGLWRVHIHIKKDGILIDDTQYFDITF